MAKRKPWSKRWDALYLADITITQMTPAEQGILNLLWSILRTQTDEPGVFIKDGSIMDLSAIGRAVKPRCSGGGARLDIVCKWVSTVLQIGDFQQREDGAWFCPYIVKEEQSAEIAAAYGRKGRAKQLGALHYSGNDTAPKTPGGTPGPTPGPEVYTDADTEVDADADRPGPGGGPPAADTLVVIWNEEARTPIHQASMSPARREKARALLREKPSLDYWRTVIRRINASPRCRGENRDGWVATFNWLLKPDTHVTVMEGDFDEHARASPQKSSSRVSEQNTKNAMAVLERHKQIQEAQS